MSFSKIYVHQSIASHPVSRRFINSFNGRVVIIENESQVFDHIKQSDDPIGAGKKTVLLTRNKGAFLKKCPGTQNYTCCDYHILHFGSFCTMDCAYCILQAYFHPPVLQFFVNHDDMFSEIKSIFSSRKVVRIGTGEFTDSLIWEPWTDLTPRLVNLFSAQDTTILELKTKTTAIEKLAGLDHREKTVVSWSLNTPRVIAAQERGTASLSARLRAAVRCQQWGYRLAFHFDPLIIYPGCENEYLEVIDQLLDKIDPENIVWISMGSFRFIPALKQIVENRFRQSKILYGEFVPGLDGKMRYFKPLRTFLYREMANRIHHLAPSVLVYLCMEDDNVWQDVFGFTPQGRGGLPAMLDKSAIRMCGLLS